MKTHLKSITILIACVVFASTQSHNVRRRSNILPTGSHKRSARHKINYPSSEMLTPYLLQPPPLTLTSATSDHHFQWWDTGSPELVQSGWYGFNRVSPRTARTMKNSSDRKARTAYLLGESSEIHPQTHNFQKQYNENQAIFEILKELQRNIRPLQQKQSYVEPRIIMIDDAYRLPPGVLVPVRHPMYQRHYSTYQPPRKDLRPTSARYRQHQSPSATTPVTIKVVPLKISSIDIANALKSMTFLPFPLDLVQSNGKSDGTSGDISYDDKMSSADDESDLPPQSSHVAMPGDKPLGITYADSQRSEHLISNYQPR